MMMMMMTVIDGYSTHLSTHWWCLTHSKILMGSLGDHHSTTSLGSLKEP
jgi:hypothetical protein